MGNRYNSYCAGMLDASREIGIDPPDGMREDDFDYPEDEDLDAFEYMRGQVAGLLHYCKQARQAKAKEE